MSFTRRARMCATQLLLYFVILCHFNGSKPFLNGTIRKQTFPNRFGCRCGAISSAVYCPPPNERLPFHRMLSHVYVLHANCLSNLDADFIMVLHIFLCFGFVFPCGVRVRYVWFCISYLCRSWRQPKHTNPYTCNHAWYALSPQQITSTSNTILPESIIMMYNAS